QATNTSTPKEYSFNYNPPNTGIRFYRLKILDQNNSPEYSLIIDIPGVHENEVIITPGVVNNGRLSIRLNKPFRSLQLLDMNGRVLKTQNAGEFSGMFSMDVSGL